jgi:uncharacterized protein
MDLESIKQLSFHLLGKKSSHPWKEIGNKFHHGERVAKLVIELRKQIITDDNSHDEILIAAALFHDVLNGVNNHEILGAEYARKLLKNFCSKYELDEICEIIRLHDDRRPLENHFTDYIKIHQDADLLDHFGTFDIWSVFTYSVYHKQSITDVNHWFANTYPLEYQKHRDEINFDLSKQIYDEKSIFVRSFAERLKVEGEGGIWQFEELLKSDI